MATKKPSKKQLDLSPPADVEAVLPENGPIDVASRELDQAVSKATRTRGKTVHAAHASPPAPHGAATGRRSTRPRIDRAQGDAECLHNHFEVPRATINDSTPLSGDLSAEPFRLPDFRDTQSAGGPASLELIRDVALDMKIELGRTQMNLEDVLRLHPGSVVALDKLAGDMVDIVVNGRLIARGEVAVLNDSFCVRVAELIETD